MKKTNWNVEMEHLATQILRAGAVVMAGVVVQDARKTIPLCVLRKNVLGERIIVAIQQFPTASSMAVSGHVTCSNRIPQKIYV